MSSGHGQDRQALWGLAIVGLGAAVGPLDFAVNVAFPAITQAFDLETRAIRWVAVCYVLTYGSLMLAFGALGDRIGHLRVFRAGLWLGALAFALCALSPSYAWLLAARVLQGVAVGLTLSCAPALATALFPEPRRTWALSAYAGMAALAGAAAPLLGGASMMLAGWAGVYWFRVPLVLLALLCLPVLRNRLAAQPLRPGAPFDHAGALMLALGMGCVLLVPALMGPGVAWESAAAPGALGVIVLAAYARRQRASTTPLLPRELARSRAFLLHNVGNVVVQFSSFAVPLVVPYYLVTVAGWGPLAGGLMLCAWALGTMLGSGLAARVVQRLGVDRTTVVGGLMAAVGLALIARWHADFGPWTMVACLAVQGTGLGLYQVAYTDQVVAALPVSQRGVAGSLSMVTRTIGVILGASLLTWILQSGVGAGAVVGADAGRTPDAFLEAFATVFLSAAGAIVALIAVRLVSARFQFSG